ncbi:MAG TPA: FAD-binding and (Fe-S)-binding domain-containing protein, partial [Longimicrobiales bacterium]|nr:FAD-binding and (Fe-S)-binding domain-containing protein [Longimicrobiales bacterium]
VRFDAQARALYATDASNYRQVPIGLVRPRDTEDVVAALAVCREHGAPVLTRGGGTSLAGQGCNAAVVLDFSRHMNRVLDVDPASRTARVEPGAILDSLRTAANTHALTFGPDPATHAWCTLGGMIGNNSCGVHSVTAGRTQDNVEALEVLTADGERLRVGATTDAELERRIAGGGRAGEIYAGLRDIRDRYGDLVRQRFPKIARRVSGYSLDALLPEHGFQVARALVGSEGTCAVTLEATLRLVEYPAARTLLLLAYPDIFAAADHVPAILEQGPSGLEGMDAKLIEAMRRKGLMLDALGLLPEGGGWLLAEFSGESRAHANERARGALRALEGGGPTAARVTESEQEQARIWAIRESALGASVFVPGMRTTWEGWEDAAVPPERLGSYLRKLSVLLERYDYDVVMYGHFGDGCVHNRVTFELETEEGVRAFRAFLEEAADLVVAHGGSISGEHGDGQARGALLPRMYGEELVDGFRAFKRLWDPENRLNPGKLIDPWGPHENLRHGPGFRAATPETHFRFPTDGGSFGMATLRCVGVGKCRRPEGGTMCPSYMVTREEQHSTRGRAHLLFEMLHGELRDEGWRSEEVKDALDLCLACKGCKGECPATVDVATYKAEFLSHYYEGRLRPPAAYAMGLIHRWAPLAARAPWLVNAVSSAPLLSGLLKRVAGIAPERALPRFASETFRAWFGRRGASARTAPADATRVARRAGGGAGAPAETRPVPGGGSGAGHAAPPARAPLRVVLWADTFTDHFTPDNARAALEVLEAAGFEVVVPRRRVCCGRPLYDWGFLDRAEGLLRGALETLREEIEAGTPVVGLEPSCVATFRDELPNLFPDDPLARRLAGQTMLLSELLETHAPDFALPRVGGSAVVHGHCHHKAVLGFGAHVRALERMGIAAQVPDSGCCGMAGAFGFQAEHYEVAQACGERVLLPAVRAAPADVPVLTDGFSCREMIEQGTERRPLHLARVIRDGLAAEGRLRPRP